MVRSGRSVAVPMEIRNDCLLAFQRVIPELGSIAKGEVEGVTPSVRLSAINLLARMGLSGRKSILIGNLEIVDIAVRAAAEMFDLNEGQEKRLVNRIIEEAEALGDDVSDLGNGDEPG